MIKNHDSVTSLLNITLVQKQVTMEIYNKSEWPAISRVIFKFICIYLVLYALPAQMLYQDVIIWFGRQFLGVEGSVSTVMTGSGDMLYHWLTFWFHLLVTVIGTLIWTAIDRNRKSYHRMAEGLYIFARYYLAFVLLGYGIGKVIPMQFSEPNLIRLTQEYGNSSPMGLAWTFMGFSTGYQMFAGFMEVLGAALLFFRRTVLIGSLVTIAVMTNVFMINMFFDVPVKLFSAHLLLIATGLACLNLKPLWNFLVMGRPSQKIQRPFPFKDRRWRIICYTIQAVCIGGVVIFQFYFLFNQYLSQPEPLEIAGIYDVAEFKLGSEALEPISTDSFRWRRVVIDNRVTGLIAVDYMTGDRVQFRATIIAAADSISGFVPPNPRLRDTGRSALSAIWNFNAEDELILKGKLGGESLYVRLGKIKHEELLIISRGFNWVNERPYNR